ncbi:MAG: alpha/beta fold hydrolase [Alphaproteobacteria bacterium]
MISLKDFGSFHIGGRRVEISGQPTQTLSFTPGTSYNADPNGTYLIEQAYVQYYIPEVQKHELPVLLVHGGGMTGSNWETTPDGRPGWIQRFLEAGFATYVIDNVERGRSGWCALPDQWEGRAVIRSQEQAWTLFRFGRAEDFATGTPFLGMQFPIDAQDAFARQFVPRWTTTTDVMKAGLLAALERIGPCVVVCHSQGGELTLDTVAQRPDLVCHAVALEPSGFPSVETAQRLADQHWLFVMGDNIEGHPFWVPLMAQTTAAVDALLNYGSDASLLDLPKSGIEGNSHMIMMDLNSDTVFNHVHDWMEQRL